MRRRFVVALAAVTLSSGCAGLGRQEDRVDVAVADLQMLQPGLLQQTLSVRLRVRNLEPEPLSVSGARFELWIAGERVGIGTAKGDVVVPGLEAADLPGELSIDTLEVVQRLTSLRSGGISYTIDGILFTRGSLMGRTPFSKNATLDLRGALAP